jgi:alkylation response protein AidB-like acyl-CoA dehydrogenase
MSTTAVDYGETIALDGAKTFVTNGPDADLFVVFATSDRAFGWAGASCYLAERGTDGLAVEPALRAMSSSAAPMAELVLSGCRVPVEHRLGRAGAGLAIFTHAMELERSLLAAGLVGASLGRLRGGARGAVASDRAAALWSRAVIARLLVQRAAERLDSGKSAPLESSLAKLAASELWVAVAGEVVSGLGAAGMLDAGLRDLADSVAGRIYSGTSELQRELLGRRLGL